MSRFNTIRLVTFVAVLGVLSGLVVSPALAFNLFSPPTAWDPGANTARDFTGSSPGGATFSIMGAGFTDVSPMASDPGHAANMTQSITALGVLDPNTNLSWGIADYAAVIDWALDTWAGPSFFTNLGEVTDGGVNAGDATLNGGHLGDIRVAAWDISTSNPQIPYTTLAHAFQPDTDSTPTAAMLGTIGGDIHFDTTFTWVDDPLDMVGNMQFDIYTVALHEVGHALGLDHLETAVLNAVMNPTYGGARRSLSQDDITGIQTLYGIPEPSTLLLSLLGLTAGVISYRRNNKA